jgi:type VI secretion system secreted protein Hcp
MAQEDYFLDLEGVEGESQDDAFKNKIHMTSFSFGVTNAGTGGINTGSGAGRCSMQDLHFTKVMDKASPNLFIGCCTGKHFTKATITVRRAGSEEKPQTYLTYDLTEVFISSYSTSGAEGGGIAQESVSLNFSKVKMTYFAQNAQGGGTTAIPKTYDIKANKAT